MEIILAVVLATAVILFGALISLGNERQRKAIDSLREQIVGWSLQDLKLKREQLKYDVKVEDPLGWLNKITSRACGYTNNLRLVDAFAEPQALVCSSEDGAKSMVFSTLSPNELQKLRQENKNRLSRAMDGNPLVRLPLKVIVHELSALNHGGLLFDLELAIVWKALTNEDAKQTERIWMYIF